jgi:hypothetical protein
MVMTANNAGTRKPTNESGWWWVSMADDDDEGSFIGACVVSAESADEAEGNAARIARRRPEFVDFLAVRIDAARMPIPEPEWRNRLLTASECVEQFGSIEIVSD